MDTAEFMDLSSDDEGGEAGSRAVHFDSDVASDAKQLNQENDHKKVRQVGILCADALVALHENLPKLESDHKKARLMDDGLNKIQGLRVDTSSLETNIIYIEIEEFSGAAKLCKN
ncbi:hypothetical protein PIB30_090739 [Stylosanthes scabra]|uniref:Aromatic amino acid beta-eliminating lyase/threonine aldolase domain-containing protein n=1 Tax=Stylosanthes scabra TaxID=79078 RepID=A0ABU6XTF0_9FABA|nr:hypothetical protein [Stylosanthes scabra]